MFEQLYDLGLRDFVIVIRKNKDAIINHFSIDWSYVDMLTKKENIRKRKDWLGYLKKLKIVEYNL